MCCRFALKSSPQAISNLLNVEKAVEWKPRYNVAPSQKIPAAVHRLENKNREIKLLQWGFVAPWTESNRVLVNIRSEEIDEKPLFQDSFENRRCIIQVDGFYEWRHQGKETRPYFFRMKKNQPFALAGLWASQEMEGEKIEVCAILTTTPNEVVRVIHNRMPVIVDPGDFDTWLDSKDVNDSRAIEKIFRPYPANKMEFYQVGPWVNNAFHDDPKCLERSMEPETLPFLY